MGFWRRRKTGSPNQQGQPFRVQSVYNFQEFVPEEVKVSRVIRNPSFEQVIESVPLFYPKRYDMYALRQQYEKMNNYMLNEVKKVNEDEINGLYTTLTNLDNATASQIDVVVLRESVDELVRKLFVLDWIRKQRGILEGQPTPKPAPEPVKPKYTPYQWHPPTWKVGRVEPLAKRINDFSVWLHQYGAYFGEIIVESGNPNNNYNIVNIRMNFDSSPHKARMLNNGLWIYDFLLKALRVGKPVKRGPAYEVKMRPGVFEIYLKSS